MEQLKEFFTDKQVAEIIDVGTGTGDFIEVLMYVFPKAQITGIDPNTESLQEAEKKYPDVSFSEMSGEKLEFGDNTFDLASISMALHHLPDVQIALKEMQRVVKPNGWIIVNELFSDNLNPAQEVHKMFHHFRSKIDRLTGVSHHETFQKKEIREMIKKSGIQILFDFENNTGKNLITEPGELEIRVVKMEQHLEKIKDLPEYNLLKLQIEKFRQKAIKHGFQPATRIVLVGKPGK